jgi:uncharacterized protein YxjI
MRYVMRQKLLSWGDDFTIKDEAGKDAFFVDGKALSFGDKLSFQDMAGKELVFIKQKLLNLSPTFELWRGDQMLAEVKRELFSFIHHRFTVDVPGPDDLEAEGDFLDHEYAFTRGGKTVATVSKRWFAWTDTYGIEIEDKEDAVLILASAVVVDMACHRDDGKRR